MGLVKKSITVTEQQNEWIKNRIVNGDYGNDSEYLRDLIRKDRTENEKFIRLKNAIQEGIDSGICDDTIEDIMLSVEKDLKRNGQV